MNSIRVTWLGHAAFQIISPSGKVIYIDPWLDNPRCPESHRTVSKADIILVTHGHFDHLGNTVTIAKQQGSTVIGIFELYLHLVSLGVENSMGMNKGGTIPLNGIKVTMVSADHSSGAQVDEQIVYCGDPVGYVITFENNYRLYHAGDTNVFGDMKLLGKLYKPDVALLPIGDLYTMGPAEAAEAIRLLGVRTVIPMHYGTFPQLTGTPEELLKLTKNIENLQIFVPQPGETLTLPQERDVA